MVAPSFTMHQLLEAGVHFGHSTRRWNPRMAPYLWGSRNGVHIIDLEQTVPLLGQALDAVRSVVAGGGRVLFVGTKRQASEKIAESAQRCGQYYVNYRWPGGMLTNWKTISNSIKRMRMLEEKFESGVVNALTKREQMSMQRQLDKLRMTLDGIRDIGGLPDIVVVIDTNKERLAVTEANVLKIPVVGILDSNSDPQGIDYPVPGNDDAQRAITLYCDLMMNAVLDGIQVEVTASGVDLGAAENIDDLVPTVEQKADAGGEAPEGEATGDSSEASTEAQPTQPQTDSKEAKGEDKAPKEESKS